MLAATPGDPASGDTAVKVSDILRVKGGTLYTVAPESALNDAVKTMAAEQLQRVGIGPLGIEGDRVMHVEDAGGRLITSRSHPRGSGAPSTRSRTSRSVGFSL